MPALSKPLLNHCAVFSGDLDRSVKFYDDACGLKVKARWKEIVLVTEGTEQRIPLPGVHLEDSEGPVELPQTRRILATLCDLRVPLTFSEADCALIGEIIGESVAAIRESGKGPAL